MDETIDTNDRPERERRTVERLTYNTLGETHQQLDATKVRFSDIELEQCHNITTTDARIHKDIKYNGNKAML